MSSNTFQKSSGLFHAVLQPLRVSMGWVEYNTLYEIDPNSPALPDELRREYFRQDLLQFRHPRYNRLVDIGWYPHCDLVTGEYGLVLYEGNFRGRLLHEFQSRFRPAIVAELERVLSEVSEARLQRVKSTRSNSVPEIPMMPVPLGSPTPC